MAWKDTRDKLCYTIFAISQHYGGDDSEWLRIYCREVVNQYRDNLNVAYDCFAEVAKSLGIEVSFGKVVAPVETRICSRCGYVPPFCYGKCK